MKKLLTLVFVLGIVLPAFAGVKIKDVIGTWKYEVVVDSNSLTGIVTFEKKNGELNGEVNTDDGDTFPLTLIEIREDNVLYLELTSAEGEHLQISVTVTGKKFRGKIIHPAGEAPITAEKIK